jgi:uncharacterized membrane protein
VAAAAANHRQHRLWVIRTVRERPRLFLSLVVGLVAWLAQPSAWWEATRLLIAWNFGAWLYLVLAGVMMARASQADIRRRALDQDESRFVILGLTVVAAGASIGAIVAQLGGVKDTVGLAKAAHVGLAIATIVSAWALIHLMFTLHYAHEYSREWHSEPEKDERIRGGLNFPDTNTPSYADFMYFSYVIGVASQTADVQITSAPMRRIALAHGILSFFFNTTLLALSINIAAGLI